MYGSLAENEEDDATSTNPILTSVSYTHLVKAIGNTFGRRKADAGNLLHVRSHIQSNLAHLVTAETG